MNWNPPDSSPPTACKHGVRVELAIPQFNTPVAHPPRKHSHVRWDSSPVRESLRDSYVGRRSPDPAALHNQDAKDQTALPSARSPRNVYNCILVI